MNSSVQTRSFELWNQFHNTIANELNAEKNLKDKDSLFLFLDQRIVVIKGFIQQLYYPQASLIKMIYLLSPFP
jgi:hypothetical protein